MKLCESCAQQTIAHTTVRLFLMILYCSKFGKSLLSYNSLLCTEAQMFPYLFCESLVLVVQDLIKVVTLEEACIIARSLMRHASLKLGSADGTVIPFMPHPAVFRWM